jgi:hypothetical protein
MVIAEAHLLRHSSSNCCQARKKLGWPRYGAEGYCALHRAGQSKGAAHAPEAAFRPRVNTESGLELCIFVTQHDDAGAAQGGQGFA